MNLNTLTMKKFLKILGYLIGAILLILLLAYLFFYIKKSADSAANMKLLGKEAPVLSSNGFQYRDLNKNGKLDTYEDKRVDLENRVEDLLSQMSIEEKAGLLFFNIIMMDKDGDLLEVPSLTDPFSWVMESSSSMVVKKHMNHFNVLMIPSAKAMVTWHNHLQKMAERTRLGIPVTIGSDPRHNRMENIGAAIATDFLSRWPSQLGLGAIGDSAIVREFGDIARQEYLAMGIRVALHPMADLATEPRWTRVNGTFGEDAHLSAKLTAAYILGFQGDSLTNTSVACMTKHFSGGGPQEDGWDAHFASGKGQVYPGNNFDYHLIPFTEGAFPAKTAQIMPYYGIPKGQTSEDVGFAFNKDIITGLLRDSLGFDGVVCTDWTIITDVSVKEASAWGVEHLSEPARVQKVLDAGCDMFGGEACPGFVVQLVKEGKVSEKRIDESVRRVLRDKFRLGLFDNPYLNPDNLELLGRADFVEKGKEAQRKALVLLKNENHLLPLSRDKKVYVQGMEKPELFPQLVSQPKAADVIILDLKTPSSPPPKGASFLERFFPQGRLDFPKEEKQKLLSLIQTKPTITILNIDRPPVIPDINAASEAIIANFECEDEIIMELIYGQFKPTGKLPIEIPSSAAAVEKQKEDVPYDSENPLYPYGFGLSFSTDAMPND